MELERLEPKYQMIYHVHKMLHALDIPFNSKDIRLIKFSMDKPDRLKRKNIYSKTRKHFKNNFINLSEKDKSLKTQIIYRLNDLIEELNSDFSISECDEMFHLYLLLDDLSDTGLSADPLKEFIINHVSDKNENAVSI